MIIEGPAFLLGNDVDTDTIIPTFALQLSRDPVHFGDYAFHHAIPGFKEKDVTILVAGANFGCGSSREEAVFALIHSGVRAVLARSFAPIFKRNAFNNALPCIQIDTSSIEGSDHLVIDLDEQVVINETQEKKYSFTFSAPEKTLISAGGLLHILMQKIH
ncbi:MAG: 3-isopropylmalate dehydratase small subunit [Theionarchaea archaeon]|nr:3-isopropylmalate dehydratase small subunit [Theionarchaea archaeon]